MAELSQLIVYGLATGCIYSLIALGFVLIYKATEMVNFAQGDLLMLGAFVAVTFTLKLGFQYWLAFVLAVVVMAMFSYALEAIVLRRVIGQPQFSVVMLTIGLGFIFRAAATMIWGTEPFNFPAPFGSGVSVVGGVVISHVAISIIIGTVVLCAMLWAFFQFSRIGVAMQAVSQNQLAAYYMGIPVKRIFSLIWAISGGVAAVAGILIAPLTLVDNSMSALGLKAFAAAVLGGFGSIPGALVGGVLVGMIEQVCGAYLVDSSKDVAAYVTLLLVLLLRPQGLMGAVARKKV
jgi:branched-chain amino acid transport system permease protein